MSNQTIINYCGTMLLALLAWFGVEMWNSVKTLQAEHQRIVIEMTRDYVPKDELERRFDRHEAVQERFNEKLESKLDAVMKARK